MRSKENLKRFKHVTKTAQERADYTDVIAGTTKGIGEDKDDFDDTLTDEKPSGNPEPIKREEGPYRSWKTWIKQRWKEVLVIAIGLPAFGWAFTTFIGYGTNLASLNANYTNLKEDVSTMKTKYDDLNTKNIKADVLLGEIQKDIDSLSQRITSNSQR